MPARLQLQRRISLQRETAADIKTELTWHASISAALLQTPMPRCQDQLGMSDFMATGDNLRNRVTANDRPGQAPQSGQQVNLQPEHGGEVEEEKTDAEMTGRNDVRKREEG